MVGPMMLVHKQPYHSKMICELCTLFYRKTLLMKEATIDLCTPRVARGA